MKKKETLTRNEIRRISKNTAVKHVSPTGRIQYEIWFREHIAKELEKGGSPVSLFRAQGLGPELIGYKRIERCCARWRTTPPFNPKTMLPALIQQVSQLTEENQQLNHLNEEYRHRIERLENKLNALAGTEEANV